MDWSLLISSGFHYDVGAMRISILTTPLLGTVLVLSQCAGAQYEGSKLDTLIPFPAPPPPHTNYHKIELVELRLPHVSRQTKGKHEL